MVLNLSVQSDHRVQITVGKRVRKKRVLREMLTDVKTWGNLWEL